MSAAPGPNGSYEPKLTARGAVSHSGCDLCSLSVKQDELIVWPMKRAFAALAVGLLVSSAALADGFRCGNKLVTEGASRSEVASKCGEPTDVTTGRSVFRRPVVWGYGRPYFVGDDFIEVPIE